MSLETLNGHLLFCKAQLTREHARASKFTLEHQLRHITDTFEQIMKVSAKRYSLSQVEETKTSNCTRCYQMPSLRENGQTLIRLP